MKVIYEFCPYEDKDELEIFQKAQKTHEVLNEIREYCRRQLKYCDMSEESKGMIETIQDYFKEYDL